MSIQTELERIIEAKADIIQAIKDMQGVVEGNPPIEDLADCIRTIPVPEPDPNPLGLPAYTIRLQYEDGKTPTFAKGTATQVSVSPNVWDLTYENNDWTELLVNQYYMTDVLGANTTDVTIMDKLFYNSSDLINIAYFDTSNVTSMSEMFHICTDLISVPKYKTKNVTNMHYMFGGCNKLTTVPLFDTSKVTDMSYMFEGCDKLSQVPLFNTSNVTNMKGMFMITNGSSNVLTEIPLFDTSNVTDMSNMFYHQAGISTVPLFNTSKVTDMSSMFQECISLTTIPLFDTSNVTIASYAYSNCPEVESGALNMYQQLSTQATTVVLHIQTFTNCGINTETGTAELAQIPKSWGGTKQ